MYWDDSHFPASLGREPAAGHAIGGKGHSTIDVELSIAFTVGRLRELWAA